MEETDNRDKRRQHLRTIASKGGKTTAARYGREYMSRIGKKGFRAALECSNYSDAGHMISHWIERGRLTKR
jgi:general stress protein YciG